MPLAVYGGAASAHGKAHDGAVLLVGLDAVAAFKRGNQLPEEEIFVRPARHVEIAVPHVVHVGAACIGHEDDHLGDCARGDELVHHFLHVPVVLPGLVGVGKSMKQIHHGVELFCRSIVALRQINVYLDVLAQQLAGDAVGDNLTPLEGLRHSRNGGKRQDENDCNPFHNQKILMPSAFMAATASTWPSSSTHASAFSGMLTS